LKTRVKAISLVSYEKELTPTPELSLKSLARVVWEGSMHVFRCVKEKLIPILTDSGATRKFVDSSVVEKLGMPMEWNSKFIIHVMAHNSEVKGVVVMGSLSGRVPIKLARFSKRNLTQY